jgi:hypothetical protein
MDVLDSLINWLAAQGRRFEQQRPDGLYTPIGAEELRAALSTAGIRASSATFGVTVREEAALQDTTKARRPAGRKPRKFKQVLAQMSAEIAAGKVTAAQLRYWPRDELENRYGAQHITIEKALAELAG